MAQLVNLFPRNQNNTPLPHITKKKKMHKMTASLLKRYKINLYEDVYF